MALRSVYPEVKVEDVMQCWDKMREASHNLVIAWFDEVGSAEVQTTVLTEQQMVLRRVVVEFVTQNPTNLWRQSAGLRLGPIAEVPSDVSLEEAVRPTPPVAPSVEAPPIPYDEMAARLAADAPVTDLSIKFNAALGDQRDLALDKADEGTLEMKRAKSMSRGDMERDSGKRTPPPNRVHQVRENRRLQM